MGVTPAELAKHYPLLYHMAEGNSWPGIQRHGLLCTEVLLDLFEQPPESRDAILARQRLKSFVITHPTLGRATIRDQKPLNRSKLERCLQDCYFQDWLKMLNSRVFFWLCEDRLRTLMCAREYCAETHVVITLDTLRLATDFQDTITLAPMNTGNTSPYAHPRGLSSFRGMADYPFEERLARGPYYAVVELAVKAGVRNIMDYVTRATEMRCSTCDKTKTRNIVTVRELYP